MNVPFQRIVAVPWSGSTVPVPPSTTTCVPVLSPFPVDTVCPPGAWHRDANVAAR
ncbi:hypothetical protein [Luteimicrobium album]|uniref:hypothetical protein n=1 Tax=Luteimicrobium album TaxID=1054550 RepID=UPI0024E08A20|nr:hypothetical protein [Luteimicrobium album]